ncbi:OadG family transporter subunit [Bacteroides sp.]|uniref:OadG family transporter subunit n=1 Tax=Bacteroides sp. TaxID=29523 RepID=UPI001B68D020|nr:OadG family transporter subunit [Bacteroides sp.]MBP6936702.1 OadG family protein [Bacteroides sp.]MBP8622578.1 OadG family protein [Bacteroides sp.]MBP9586882.1 OadG family protein [Bacteroides sp.]
MNKKNIGILIVLFMFVCGSAYGQGAKSLVINEILTSNTEGYQDDYGKHNAWIEIFNNSFATVDIRSCYLTNDKRVLNPNLSVEERVSMMYPIPKGDVLTKIAPRQHLLFWADGLPQRGTFHLSFTLDPTQENWIALYDANGTTLLDQITVPPLTPNASYALKEDGKRFPFNSKKIAEVPMSQLTTMWEVKDGSNGKYVTPSTNNVTLDKNEKVDKFRRLDSSGIGMSIIAMGVVFSGLILLYISFRIVGGLGLMLAKRNAMKARGITDKKEAKEKAIGTESGEVFAAIAMALHECQDRVHDIEDTILTINKVKRNYSPWSSKIYTLRQDPKR